MEQELVVGFESSRCSSSLPLILGLHGGSRWAREFSLRLHLVVA